MPHTLEVLPTEDLGSIAIMVKLDLRMLNIAKQREPATVKFRAARSKNGQIYLFPSEAHPNAPFSGGWEWLDADGKAQIYEVKV